MIAVVLRDVVCARAVIDTCTCVEILTVGMRVDALIIVSNAAVDLWIHALTVNNIWRSD